MVSADGSTIVGGDGAGFLFMAQKASNVGTYSDSSANGTWSVLPFGVTGLGAVPVGSATSFSVSYPSASALGGTGTLGFVSADNAGVYPLDVDGLDENLIDIDGGFLLSPDGQYFLGAILGEGIYAGWK